MTSGSCLDFPMTFLCLCVIGPKAEARLFIGPEAEARLFRSLWSA